MAIRLRRIPGVGLVALCAARTVEKDGDVYLDDEIHRALGKKFHRDFAAMELMALPQPDRDRPPGVERDDAHYAAVEAEESNNPARDWWDRTYGPLREQR